MKKKEMPKQLRGILDFLGKNKVGLSLSIGIGSILSFFVIVFLKMKFINQIDVKASLESILASLNITDFSFVFSELMLLIIGIITLLVAPMLYQQDKKNWCLMPIVTALVFLDVILLFQAFLQQTISKLLLICITFSCILFVWIFGIFLKAMNKWLRTKDGQADVVKLTFVWTIIIALLGLSK